MIHRPPLTSESTLPAPTCNGVVYKILNVITGNFYIGSTMNYNNRVWQHRSSMRAHVHKNPNIQNEFMNFGERAFVFGVIEDNISDKINLMDKEQYYIDKLKPTYNVHINSRGPKGVKRNQKIKDKLAIAQKKENRKNIFWLDHSKRSEFISAKMSNALSFYRISIYDKKTLSYIETIKGCFFVAKKYKLKSSHYVLSLINGRYGISGNYIFRKEGVSPKKKLEYNYTIKTKDFQIKAIYNRITDIASALNVHTSNLRRDIHNAQSNRRLYKNKYFISKELV